MNEALPCKDKMFTQSRQERKERIPGVGISSYYDLAPLRLCVKFFFARDSTKLTERNCTYQVESQRRGLVSADRKADRTNSNLTSGIDAPGLPFDRLTATYPDELIDCMKLPGRQSLTVGLLVPESDLACM